MKIQNTGQTPAFNVSVWAWISVIEPINEANLSIPVMSRKGSTLGAGSDMPKIQNLGRKRTGSEITDLNAGVKRIYFHGRIEYVTLGERRSTSFRLYHRGGYPAQANMIFYHCDNGNSAD